jgi:hypothetical protein
MRKSGLRAILGTGWLAVLLAAGCASNSAVQTQPIGSYEFRQVQGGVQVALDPYFQEDRAKQVFSTADQFAEAGLLPVQVVIQNGSTRAVKIDPLNFLLLRPNGQQGISLSPQDAFTLVRKAVGMWALFPILGQSAVGIQNDMRLREFESRALRAAEIQPEQSASGFIYLQLPASESNLAGSRVLCVLHDGEGKELNYQILLAGRRDAPPQAAAPAPRPAAPTATPVSPGGPIIIEGTGGKGVIIKSQ